VFDHMQIQSKMH